MFFNLSPTSSKMRSYIPKGGSIPLWLPSVGQNKRDIWVKVDDENDSFDFPHLEFIVDMVSGSRPKILRLYAFLYVERPRVHLELTLAQIRFQTFP